MDRWSLGKRMRLRMELVSVGALGLVGPGLIPRIVIRHALSGMYFLNLHNTMLKGGLKDLPSLWYGTGSHHLANQIRECAFVKKQNEDSGWDPRAPLSIQTAAPREWQLEHCARKVNDVLLPQLLAEAEPWTVIGLAYTSLFLWQCLQNSARYQLLPFLVLWI